MFIKIIGKSFFLIGFITITQTNFNIRFVQVYGEDSVLYMIKVFVVIKAIFIFEDT